MPSCRLWAICAEELKRHGATAPVVMITGHADVPLAIQAGVSDFIEKPFDDERLVYAIRKAVADQDEEKVAQAERQAIRDRIATLSGREEIATLSGREK